METKGKADQLADWRLFLIILVCRRKRELLEVDRAASITRSLLCCCDVFMAFGRANLTVNVTFVMLILCSVLEEKPLRSCEMDEENVIHMK